MTEQIINQILYIRDTGLTNMFDVRRVREIAMELDMEELADYLDSHRKEYSEFILTGRH